MRNAKNDNKKKKKASILIHDFDMTNTLTHTFYLLASGEKNVFLPGKISY